jgi:hypothetical protein
MHVQLFCENSLTRSITNSKFCSDIVYGKTTILDESPVPAPLLRGLLSCLADLINQH